MSALRMTAGERDRSTLSGCQHNTLLMSTPSSDPSPVLQNKPLSDPFLQLLSMSPKNFPSSKGMHGAQDNSANSTTSSFAPGGLTNAGQAASHKFVPQQQTVGFGETKVAKDATDASQ
ncbi:hypothetical protein ABBQ38_009432 [Trebouxia sp. C0009 RCD-2024]